MPEPVRMDNSAPLPVPVKSGGGIPATIDAHARLEAELMQLTAAVNRCDVPALRRAQRTVPHLRRAFAKVDRPATSEEILTGVNRVLRTKPLAGNINLEDLASMLMAEVAAMAPTVYELATAVREHFRAREKFVDTAVLLDEVRDARRAAVRYRRVLVVEPTERIAQIEDDARRAKRERAQAIARTREALEEMSASERRVLLERAASGVRLPGVGYVSAELLMLALDDDERDLLFAHALPAARDQLSRAAPAGWEPPNEERADALMREALDDDEGDDGEGE